MTDQNKDQKPAQSREDRLAQALRDNLKKRKVQSRKRGQTNVEVPPSDAVSNSEPDAP